MPVQINLRRGHALELLACVARERLARLAVHPQELVSVLSPGGLGRPSVYYADTACCDPTDLDALNIRLVVADPQKAEMLPLIGILELPLGAPESPRMIFVITQTGDLLVVVESDAALHADGVIQLFGAEPALLVVSGKELETYRATGAPFIKGMAVRTLWVEARGDDGLWSRSDQPLNLPASAIESVEMKNA